jgi:hypothetical protein
MTWSLVCYCRTGGVAHGRIPKGGWYDIVVGPVAASWRKRLSIQDADQVSFHTPAAASLLDQVRKPQNRHLVDIRPVIELPPAKQVKKVLVVIPPELIANKVVSTVSRQKTAKGTMDLADLRRLLLTFPDLKIEQGEVAERLRAADATEEVMAAWKELVAEEILPEDEDAGF